MLPVGVSVGKTMRVHPTTEGRTRPLNWPSASVGRGAANTGLKTVGDIVR